MLQHEESYCWQKEVTCPARHCSKKFIIAKSKFHFEWHHGIKHVYTPVPSNNGSHLEVIPAGQSTNEKSFSMINFQSKLFLLHVMDTGRSLVVALYFLGTQGEAKKFCWTAMTDYERISPQIKYNGPVLSIDDDTDSILEENRAFEYSKDVLFAYRYKHEDGKIAVDLRISIQSGK